MDTSFQGTKGVICYINGILITGRDDIPHLTYLAEVFRRLQTFVYFLGYKIDRSGIHTTKEKVEAI